MIEKKVKTSTKLNDDLENSLFRLGTIINYYKENPERLNFYKEQVSKDKIIEQGNIKYVRQICDEYYKLSERVREEYGVVLGNNHKKWFDTETDFAKQMYVLDNNNDFDVESDLIEKYSNLGREIEPLRKTMNEVERSTK